ncbi:MAG: prenyltransferase [Methanospirillum sp.]|nr:prenyltransferase [Methanospirillum sp.]
MTPARGGLLAYACRLSRPLFWIYTGGTYVVGFALGMPDWHAFLMPAYMAALLYFFFPANLFIYGVNDLFDQDTDRQNPKKECREYRYSVPDRDRLVLLIGFSLACTVLLASAVPDSRLALVLAGFLFLSASYSAPPLRFKRLPFLDFASNVLYAMPGVYGYLLASGNWPPAWLLLGAFFHVAAMHLFSAVPDIECDRAAGITTTAVFLGRERSLCLCLVFWSCLSLIVILASDVRPLSLLVLAYPVVPALLLLDREIPIDRAYWRLPAINTALGGLVFTAVSVAKGGF